MNKLIAAFAASLLVGTAGAFAGEHALPSAGAKHIVSGLQHFDPWPEVGQPVADGKAQLITTEQGITAIVETSELPPGEAVTVWWIIFNNPEACSAHPEPCTDEDLSEIPETAGEVSWAAGAKWVRLSSQTRSSPLLIHSAKAAERRSCSS
jgi:hypothetical protein